MNASSFKDIESLEKHFNKIAGLLMNRIVLIVNEKQYRFTELEFYFYSPGFHEDPYIHEHKLQLETGHWYFHPSGLDITFGDGINHGGILIRGMRRIYAEKGFFISGPLKVVHEIFLSMGNICGHEQVLRLMDTDEMPGEELVRSTRIGLKEKEPAGFIDKYYRYITFPFEPSHDYAEKTLVAHSMLNEEKQMKKYSKEEINEGFRWIIVK